MYVPVDKDKKEDILYYNNEANTAELDIPGNKVQIYDGTAGEPPISPKFPSQFPKNN